MLPSRCHDHHSCDIYMHANIPKRTKHACARGRCKSFADQTPRNPHNVWTGRRHTLVRFMSKTQTHTSFCHYIQFQILCACTTRVQARHHHHVLHREIACFKNIIRLPVAPCCAAPRASMLPAPGLFHHRRRQPPALAQTPRCCAPSARSSPARNLRNSWRLRAQPNTPVAARP